MQKIKPIVVTVVTIAIVGVGLISALWAKDALITITKDYQPPPQE